MTGWSYFRTDCAPGSGTVSGGGLQREVKANAPGGVGAEIQKHRLSHIVGKRVENLNGEVLGRIKDFVADMRSGEIKYAILSSGGFLGLGSRLRVVPAQALSTATTIKGVVALDASRARWRRAPDFKRGGLAALSNPAREQQIYQYYGQPLPGGGGGERPLTPTWRENGGSGGQAGKTGGLQLTSRLLRKAVMNRQGKAIGEITDLLVDLGGHKPAIAILSAERLLDRDESFAVPLRLVRSAGKKGLTLDANRQMFEQAPSFNEAAWQATRSNGRGIYRYLEAVKADNTRRNALAWARENLTPFSQSGAEGDREITRRIRAAVVENEALSLTAKNIKIITVGGMVTLLGPVHTDREKEEIGRAAAQIAGRKNLKDQLEVGLK
jgi:osmotically-inducible protein OsmY/sporulation protein YlmC with PRC-barrel domain